MGAQTVIGKNYIRGEWVDASSGETFESRNPANSDQVLGRFPRSVKEDVVRAVEAAREAFDSWRRISMVRRGELFDEVVQMIKRDKEDLAALVSMECGKGINEGRADVVEGIHMLQYVCGLARMPFGEVVASEIAEKDAYMRRKPKGVMGAITPWNFPFAIPTWLLGPSLIMGNTVVFKPAEETSLTAYRLVEYFHRAGFPPGVINLVTGYGEEAGAPLVEHPYVCGVLFTGSYEVGSKIKRICAEHHNKLAVCEMGGKNALIVLDDADMKIALNAAILSAYKTTGQRCVSAGRMIVDEKLVDEFASRFVELSRRVRIGNPLDETIFMGPLVSENGRKKVEHHNEMAVKEGAEILLKGGRLTGKEYDKGYFISPFVYRMEHRSDSFVLREEAFGPHVAIIPVKGIEHAAEVYNDTEYGLAMSVITEDYRKARYMRDMCDYGIGYHNLPTIGAEVQLPFGGVKRSGTGMPSAAGLVEAVSHRTAWTVNHDKAIKMAQGLSADIT